MATKIVSFSELDAYRQCRLKHHLGYKERWKPPTTAPALSRGGLFHQVLELHYTRLKEGMKLAGIIQEIQTSGLLSDPDTGQSTEEQDLVGWIYKGHVDHYGDDRNWEILEVEMPVLDWLPTETGNRSTFKMKGKVDLLVQDHSAGGGLWIVDHKTCKNLPKGKDVDFDDQMGVYTYLLRRRGLDIRGAIFNFCRTQRNKKPMSFDERFKRVITVRQDKELETMAAEVLDTFREAYRPRAGGRLPPRSPDPERCGWRCSFTEPCLGGRKGIDIHELLKDHEFEQDFTRH